MGLYGELQWEQLSPAYFGTIHMTVRSSSIQRNFGFFFQWLKFSVIQILDIFCKFSLNQRWTNVSNNDLILQVILYLIFYMNVFWKFRIFNFCVTIKIIVKPWQQKTAVNTRFYQKWVHCPLFTIFCWGGTKHVKNR